MKATTTLSSFFPLPRSQRVASSCSSTLPCVSRNIHNRISIVPSCHNNLPLSVFRPRFPIVPPRRATSLRKSSFATDQSVLDFEEHESIEAQDEDEISINWQSELPWIRDWHNAITERRMSTVAAGLAEFVAKRESGSLAAAEIVSGYTLAVVSSCHADFDKALRLFEEMVHQHHVLPGAWVYQVLMKECYSRGRAKNARELILDARRRLQQIPSGLYLLYVRILGRLGDAAGARTAFQEMLHTGVQPTETNLNVLLLAVRGDFALAESVMAMIKENGFKITYSAYAHVIGAAATNNNRELAFRLYSQCVSEGITLPLQALRSLVSLARALNDHERTLQLYDAIRHAGYNPLDVRLLTTALTAAFKLNRLEKALAIQGEAEAAGIRDEVFLRIAIEGSLKLRQWDRLVAIYEDMLKSGQAFTMHWPWYRLFIGDILERTDPKEGAQLLQRLFALEDKAIAAAPAQTEKQQKLVADEEDEGLEEEIEDEIAEKINT